MFFEEEKPATTRGPVAPPRRPAVAETVPPFHVIKPGLGNQGLANQPAPAERPTLGGLIGRLRAVESALEAQVQGLTGLADWLTGPKSAVEADPSGSAACCLDDLERLVERLGRLEERINDARLRLASGLGDHL